MVDVANPLISVETNFDSEYIGNFFSKLDSKIERKLKIKLRESLEYLRKKIADLAPERTGNLKELIRSIPISGVRQNGFKIFGGKPGVIKISLKLNRKKDRKIMWVNDGTGIYGPHGTPIVPVKSPFLAFKINGKWIRTPFVLGQKPQRFIQKGINVSKLIIISKVGSAFGG